MSLRLRLFIVIGTIITAHTLWQLVSLGSRAQDNITQSQKRLSEWTARTLKNSLVNALVSGDFATVRSTVELVFDEDKFLQLSVVDEQRRTIADFKATTLHITKVPQWYRHWVQPSVTASSYAIEIGGVRYGQVSVTASPEPILASAWADSVKTLVSALVEAFVVVLLLWFVLKRNFRPLQDLSETVRRIGSGEFSLPPPKFNVSEFAGISQGIHDMSRHIEGLIERTRQQAASEVYAKRLRDFHTIITDTESTDTRITAALQMVLNELNMEAAFLSLDKTYVPLYTVGNFSPSHLFPQSLFAQQIVMAVGNTVMAQNSGPTGTFVYALLSRDDQCAVNLAIYHTRPREQTFHQSDLEFVRLVGRWIVLAMNLDAQAQALWEQKERAQVTLASIGDGVITTDVAGRISYLNSVAESMCGWSHTDALGEPVEKIFHVIHEKTRDLVQSPVTQCLQAKKVVLLANHSVLVRRDGQEFAIEDSAAPICDRNGNMLGAVLVFHDVSESRILARKLEYQATHDALTALPNRRSFETSAERLITNAKHGIATHALCYIDLDQFKIVNDTSGHEAGDELLRRIAVLLTGRVRGVDILARLGGDEFGLLLAHVNSQQALTVVEEMRQLVERLCFCWLDKSFHIGASFGVVMLDRNSGTLADVLRQADIACYAAKHAGRNRIQLYHAEDQSTTRVVREIDWVQRLQNAISEKRLVLWAQSMRSLCGNTQDEYYEVLVRLIEPNGSLIEPHEFLPAAERYGLMAEIDRYILRQAFEFMGRRHNQNENLRCAINLSSALLNDSQSLSYIKNTMAEYHVHPSCVCFEILESVAVDHLAALTALMLALKEMGCRFALDDFGAGFSSLSYLRQLPVDIIKIDGRFISKLKGDPVDDAILQMLTQVAKFTAKRTVAECVEDSQLIPRLRTLGVDTIQGFALSRPVPIEEIPSGQTLWEGAR